MMISIDKIINDTNANGMQLKDEWNMLSIEAVQKKKEYSIWNGTLSVHF